ncbi:MAG: AAA family ATPase [Acutalibacteraceae bacterium]|nr:AAA family ATPase [Acutalibacteraceae bacterium]
MENKTFYELPERPDFGTACENKEAAEKRAYLIREDADECLKIIANNAEYCAVYSDTILNAAIEQPFKMNFVKSGLKDKYLNSYKNVYDILVRQFQNLELRYKDLEDNYHVDSFVKYSLIELDKTYALGIYHENYSNNSYENLVSQVEFVINGTYDNDNVLGDLLSACVSQQMEEKKEANNSQFQFVKSDTKLKDVAGLKEVKEDLKQIIDFIKRPQVYKAYGAKLPKGTILYGPPGTGKTLLARAVAGEADANFIALAATDFTASKWGEVPKMIKELFDVARKYAPCIIFIDEIDMLGLNRGADKANSLAHRESLNAFLSAMDGFNQYEGVTVMAATNRLEDLDPAMTRPGRFDNIFAVNLPSNIDEVEEVVLIYMKNKRFDANVKSREVAKKLLRMSPAMIEGVLNEACLIAIRKNNGIIRECDINEAYLKKIIKGHVKDNQEVPYEESKMVAIHEAGHALVAVAQGVSVQSVTIMGTTSGAGGLTMMNPSDKHYFRKSDYENSIRVSYGGRAAEQLAFGVDMVTTGASADIRNATSLIREAAENYGFNLCDTKTHAPVVYKAISQAHIETAANKYYKETIEILKNNVKALREIASALLENGTISGEMVQAIYENNKNIGIELVSEM